MSFLTRVEINSPSQTTAGSGVFYLELPDRCGDRLSQSNLELPDQGGDGTVLS